jgi:hypothetical protein
MMLMKTLKDVANEIIDQLVGAGRTFSAHDVTRKVRDAVNDPTADDFDIDCGHDVDGRFQDYLVDHSEVKEIVAERFKDGDLSRKSNGAYFLYEGANIQVKTVNVQKATATPSPASYARPTGGLSDTEIEAEIVRYLDDNGQNDLYHIQGAICRSGQKPMILMSELARVSEASKKIHIVSHGSCNSSTIVDRKW